MAIGIKRNQYGGQISPPILSQIDTLLVQAPSNTTQTPVNRKWVKNSIVNGIANNNNYAPAYGYISARSGNTFTAYSQGGYGCGFVLDVEQGRTYHAKFTSASSLSDLIWIATYDANGQFMGSNNMQTGEFDFTVGIGAEYVILFFVASVTATLEQLKLV